MPVGPWAEASAGRLAEAAQMVARVPKKRGFLQILIYSYIIWKNAETHCIAHQLLSKGSEKDTGNRSQAAPHHKRLCAEHCPQSHPLRRKSHSFEGCGRRRKAFCSGH